MTESLLQRLDAWLRAHRPDYHATLQPGATDADLDAFETTFSVALPVAFRALYGWRDGQDPQTSASLVDNQMFSSLAEVAETKQMLDGMIGYDFEDPGWWRVAWIPFLSNGGGDHLCLDADTGALFAFWHDDGVRTTEHPDVVAWLAALVASMEDGSYEVH